MTKRYMWLELCEVFSWYYDFFFKLVIKFLCYFFCFICHICINHQICVETIFRVSLLSSGIRIVWSCGKQMCESATYIWPWEQTSCRRSTPIASKVFPWEYLLVTIKPIPMENCSHLRKFDRRWIVYLINLFLKL